MVDPGLRVHRVERLGVADVSIMPQVPGDGCAPLPPLSPLLQTGPKFYGEGRDFSLLSIAAPAY